MSFHFNLEQTVSLIWSLKFNCKWKWLWVSTLDVMDGDNASIQESACKQRSMPSQRTTQPRNTDPSHHQNPTMHLQLHVHIIKPIFPLPNYAPVRQNFQSSNAPIWTDRHNIHTGNISSSFTVYLKTRLFRLVSKCPNLKCQIRDGGKLVNWIRKLFLRCFVDRKEGRSGELVQRSNSNNHKIISFCRRYYYDPTEFIWCLHVLWLYRSVDELRSQHAG